jgi:cytochrome c553
VAEKAMGDEKRGRSALARCNACHKEMGRAAVTGEARTAGQWSRWFLAGKHKLPLGGRFSYGEMSDAKAYLISKALDTAAADQGAGVP